MPAGDFGHIDSLPDGIRDIFMWLCQDVVRLYQKWDFYLGLFGKPENREIVDALPQAFGVIEESLRADMTMAICRLADPIRSCGQENLNFRALEAFYPQDNEFKRLIADFVAACEPVIKHRHKLVGHSDKVARLSPEQAMIMQIKKSEIDRIMREAEAALNHIAKRYGNTEFGFGFPGDGGAGELIYWLKKGWDNWMRPDI